MKRIEYCRLWLHSFSNSSSSTKSSNSLIVCCFAGSESRNACSSSPLSCSRFSISRLHNIGIKIEILGCRGPLHSNIAFEAASLEPFQNPLSFHDIFVIPLNGFCLSEPSLQFFLVNLARFVIKDRGVLEFCASDAQTVLFKIRSAPKHQPDTSVLPAVT